MRKFLSVSNKPNQILLWLNLYRKKKLQDIQLSMENF